MDFRTAGERLCGRELEKEKRQGTPHFVPGQHHAEIIDPDPHLTALLTWVDQFGHAVAMPCRLKDGKWEPMGSARKGGQSALFDAVSVADDYEFSPPQLAALKEAEDRD